MLHAVLISALSSPFDATGPTYARFRPNEAQLRSIAEPAYAGCIDRSGGVTANMRDCNAQEFKRLDALLNQEYRSALARLPSARSRLRLRKTQRAWLGTRWRECDRRVDEEGGTLAMLVGDACALAELSGRVLWLRAYR
jgi:uncharacterized protein YecT (DUF1311 family)